MLEVLRRTEIGVLAVILVFGLFGFFLHGFVIVGHGVVGIVMHDKGVKKIVN